MKDGWFRTRKEHYYTRRMINRSRMLHCYHYLYVARIDDLRRDENTGISRVTKLFYIESDIEK
jgi:hypothetical protein